MPREYIDYTEGVIRYRTKLLPLESARRFARCLDANARFSDVMIHHSDKANFGAQYFVTFRPSSHACQNAQCARQQSMREAHAAAEGADYVFAPTERPGVAWVFNPKSGATYEVSVHTCSCPDFCNRVRAVGLRCKHIIAYTKSVEETINA